MNYRGEEPKAISSIRLEKPLSLTRLKDLGGGRFIRRHPRIFFLSEDLPALKKYVMHTMIDEATLLDSLIKEAVTLLDEREFTITYYGGKKVTFQPPPVMPRRVDEPPGFDYKTFGHYPYWTGMGFLDEDLKGILLSLCSSLD